MVFFSDGERRRRLDSVLALAAVPAVLALGLWRLDRHGLPIAAGLEDRNSGPGRRLVALPFPVGRTGWWLQFQLVLLLAPAVVLLSAC
jgi:hypothetical protein